MRERDERDLNKMFLGLGVSKSVTFTKTKNRFWLFFSFCVVAFVFCFAFFVSRFYVNGKFSFLAERITDQTVFYLMVDIPKKGIGWNLIYPFSEKCVEHDLCTAYLDVNFLSFEGIDYKKDIAPILTSGIEIAKFENGDIAMATKIKNKDAWTSIVGQIEDGSFEKIGENFSGKIPSKASGIFGSLLTGEKDFYFWKLYGDVLLISDNESKLDEIYSFSGKSLKKDLKKFLSYSMAVFYFKDTSLFPSEYVVLADSLSAFSYPLVLSAEYSGGKIALKTHSLKYVEPQDEQKSYEQKLDKKSSKIKLIQNDLNGDLSFFINDLGGFFEKASSFEYISKFNDLSSVFYSLGGNLNQYFKEKSSAALILSKTENLQEYYWFFISAIDDVEILKKLGTALFAIKHPVIVEKILPDGTLMNEMRLDVEGIDWFDYSYSGFPDNSVMYILRAKGENSAYIAGRIPEAGIFLTNSEDFLNRAEIFNVENTNETTENKSKICGNGFDDGSTMKFSSKPISEYLEKLGFGFKMRGASVYSEERGGLCIVIE